MAGQGSIDCDTDEEWCNEMSPTGANIVFWKREGGMDSIDGRYHDINSHDAQEITSHIFNLLPNPADLDEEAFQVCISELRFVIICCNRMLLMKHMPTGDSCSTFP